MVYAKNMPQATWIHYQRLLDAAEAEGRTVRGDPEFRDLPDYPELLRQDAYRRLLGGHHPWHEIKRLRFPDEA